jgi:hypothetical protein
MHAFTLTVHSNLFAKTLADDELAAIAKHYAIVIDELMVKHGLNAYFSVEVSWARGSLLLYIAYAVLDPSVWVATGKGVAALMAFFAAYPKAKAGFDAFKHDLKATVVTKKDIEVRPYDFYFSDAKPPEKAEKIPRK